MLSIVITSAQRASAKKTFSVAFDPLFIQTSRNSEAVTRAYATAAFGLSLRERGERAAGADGGRALPSLTQRLQSLRRPRSRQARPPPPVLLHAQIPQDQRRGVAQRVLERWWATDERTNSIATVERGDAKTREAAIALVHAL